MKTTVNRIEEIEIQVTEMKYTDLKKGSKVRTKHERAIDSIDWEVINVHTEPAINGRYLTLHNGENRDKIVHECTRMQILIL